MRPPLIVLILLAAACRRDASAMARDSVRHSMRDTVSDTVRDSARDRARAAAHDTLHDSTHAAPQAAARTAPPDTGIVRGLYVNRWASQSEKKMRALIAIADSTEINGLVIDMKDEFGLNFDAKDTSVSRYAGHSGRAKHLAALLDTLKAHHILAIARVVVFKDSVTARLAPQHVIRKPDGTPWHDKKGLAWVDPYDHEIWEYNTRVAEELARMGFDEIQFDYIRFPEPYASLPPQVFKDANGVPKPKALAAFLRSACARIHAQGARCTADIFGMVTSIGGALEVGQQWSELAPEADVLLPMVYPSHYPKGSFGVAHPNAAPYLIVDSAISSAHRKNIKLGIASPIHVRAWLQAFTLGPPHYAAAEIAEQKKGVYDAGYDSWVMWSPGSEYHPFVPALERTTVSRKKAFPPKSGARE